MVDLVGVGVCTDTVANLCLGEATTLMDPDHLTLAQYQMAAGSSFPVKYGREVAFSGAPEYLNPQPLPTGFNVLTTESSAGSDSTTVSNVSDTCYFMLER